MALWTLVPDSLDDEEATENAKFGAFLTTLIAFFVVEMGDKTQVATIALGAQYQDVLSVMTGTTIGMMLANVPAVFLGHAIIEKAPLPVIRRVAASLFFVIGLWVIAQTAGLFG